MRYFFSRNVGGGVSRQAVKQCLLALLREEDPRRPRSDQDLCRLLADRGMPVARRTVTGLRPVGNSIIIAKTGGKLNHYFRGGNVLMRIYRNHMNWRAL